MRALTPCRAAFGRLWNAPALLTAQTLAAAGHDPQDPAPDGESGTPSHRQYVCVSNGGLIGLLHFIVGRDLLACRRLPCPSPSKGASMDAQGAHTDKLLGWCSGEMDRWGSCDGSINEGALCCKRQPGMRLTHVSFSVTTEIPAISQYDTETGFIAWIFQRIQAMNTGT